MELINKIWTLSRYLLSVDHRKVDGYGQGDIDSTELKTAMLPLGDERIALTAKSSLMSDSHRIQLRCLLRQQIAMYGDFGSFDVFAFDLFSRLSAIIIP